MFKNFGIFNIFSFLILGLVLYLWQQISSHIKTAPELSFISSNKFQKEPLFSRNIFINSMFYIECLNFSFFRRDCPEFSKNLVKTLFQNYIWKESFKSLVRKKEE